MQSPTTDEDIDRSAVGGELPELVPRLTRVISDDAGAAKAEALANAVRALLSAGLAAQARPLVDELIGLIESSRGPLASIIPIRRPNK